MKRTNSPADGASFSEAVPENYHRYMGPMLFEPFANDLAARLRVFDGMRVLEVACGTGRRGSRHKSVEALSSGL